MGSKTEEIGEIQAAVQQAQASSPLARSSNKIGLFSTFNQRSLAITCKLLFVMESKIESDLGVI